MKAGTAVSVTRRRMTREHCRITGCVYLRPRLIACVVGLEIL